MRRLALILAALVAAAGIALIATRWTGPGAGLTAGPTGGIGQPRPPVVGDPGRVRVEVLNASGGAGLARAATERLRDAGFDVVFYGNARSFGQDTSVVLDRVGNLDTARRVGRAISIGRVGSEPDSTLYVDVSVVIGRDWGPGAAADTLAPGGDG